MIYKLGWGGGFITNPYYQIYHSLSSWTHLYPPNIALVLTSNNFLCLFPASPPFLPSSCSFIWWLLLEIVNMPVKTVRSHKITCFWLTRTSVSVEMSWLNFHQLFYLYLSSGDLFKMFPVFSYFCVIHTSILSFSNRSLIYI